MGKTVAIVAALVVVGCNTVLSRYDNPPKYSALCMDGGDTLFVSDSVFWPTAPGSGGFLSYPPYWNFDLGPGLDVRVSGSCVIRRNAI